ncbi:MAG: ABC transporter family substrate-binding protein [Ancrocorticia sp.]|nr:ABC transporter family substrate-binding protein [Ancrocorticia sp.]MCI2001570.1 ABC transporter family substrate-binding protein [Ancrocorticia sp.]
MRTMKHIGRAGLALAAVAALALSGCSGSGSSGSTDGASASAKELPGSDLNKVDRDELQDGGTLRLAITAMPTSYNPMSSDGNTVDLNSTMAQFMMPMNWLYAEDGSFTPNTDYIEDYTMSDDGLNLTINLNPKAVWNDGTPITYKDYKADWQACNGSNADFQCAATDGWTQISSIEKGDSDYQVVVKYSQAYPDWSANFSTVTPAAGVSDATTFNEGWTDLVKVKDWFTGPFVPTEVDASANLITLKANPEWWGNTPKLDTVTFKALDTSATAQAFANNELDVVSMIIDADTYQLVQKRSDAAIRMSTSVQWRHFTFNANAGVLKDKAMRQAIEKGINTEDIAASDLAGLPTADMDMKLGNHFFMPNQEGYEDHSTKYDPEGAKKDIEALGYTMNKDSGYYEKDGKTLEIKYLRLPDTPTSANEGAMLQTQMKEIGVKITFDDTTSDEFFNRIIAGEYELVSFSWQGTPYPMANVGQIYGKPDGNNSNFTGLDVPEIDEYVSKIASETDNEERIKLTNEVDKVIWDNVMVLPLYYRANITAVPANLANYGASAFETLPAEDIGYTK